MSNRLAAWMIVAWTIIYGWVGLAAHFSLRTSAYDLSLFDYALWNTLHGRIGYVPFIGHSIFSEHFMPVLLLLAPAYAAAQNPLTLIAFQIAAAAGAAWVLHRIAVATSAGALASFAVVFAFLLSRRSHEAVTSFYYPESLQPLLTFAIVLAWLRENRIWYWIAVALFLTTKEDAAVYLAAFALIQLFFSHRRREAATTLAVAAVWLAAAVGVMIPRSRMADGLSGASHFLTARYGDAGGVAVGAIAGRIVSIGTVTRIFNILSPFAFASLAAPLWVAVIVPGLLVNRAAAPDIMQSALTGHYAFPLLPWIAVAALFGLGRIGARWPRLATAWTIAIIVVTAGDAPLFRPSTTWSVDREAAQARRQLPSAVDGGVAAQPNLVPHLPHTNDLTTLWPGVDPPAGARTVLLSPVGGVWPYADAAQVQRDVNHYGADPRLIRRSSGPLYWFEKQP